MKYEKYRRRKRNTLTAIIIVLLFLIISVLYKLKNDDEMEKEKIEQLLNKNQDDVHTSKNISPDSTKQANNAQK